MRHLRYTFYDTLTCVEKKTARGLAERGEKRTGLTGVPALEWKGR